MNDCTGNQPTFTQPTYIQPAANQPIYGQPRYDQAADARPTAGRTVASARARRNTRMVIGALTISGVALAGAVAAFAMAFSTPAGAHTPTVPPVPAVTPAVPVTPVTPVSPVAPVQPSAWMSTLQQQLGQLNYYEGPVNGIMNSQVTQSIEYLQRDAGLPQTGEMDSATTAALASMLAHGNNQMGN